jgi:WD40 repeat protein
MNGHKTINLTFGFLAVALVSVCDQALLGAARPLQIIWDNPAHEGGSFSVDFSPDGRELASGGAYIVQSGAQLFYAENKLWAARTGTLLAQTPRDQSLGATNEITFSPDGQIVATANGAVYCYPKGGCGSVAPGLADYSVSQLSLLDLTRTAPINATIDYSPDGTMLATGEYYTDYRIQIRDAADLSVIRTLPGHIEAPNNFGTFSVRFSPDGTLLASGGVDGNVKIWRVSDGALLRTLSIGTELSPNVFTVAFSPDGQFLGAGTDALRTIKAWRVSDWSLFRSFSFGNEVFGYGQSNLAWTPDSIYLVGGRTVYPTPLAIRFWNVTTGALAGEFTDDTDRAIYYIAFTPDGRAFAYTASGNVVVARTPRLR